MSAHTSTDVGHSRDLDPVPESARAARQLVLESLAEVGRTDLAEAAGLLVSELVTNAIVHARTSIVLDVAVGAGGLRVSVRDGSPNMPVPRHYGRTATTGRGLELVELLADRHGTTGDGNGGKTVWFELGTPDAGDDPAADVPPAAADLGDEVEDGLVVRLNGMPVRLALAWQQHIDALLREHVLSQWDPDTPSHGECPGDDLSAGDAFAAVAAALEGIGAAGDLTPYVDVALPLRDNAAAHFVDFDLLVEHVVDLAHRGLTLAPPTQPEIRLLRRWICDQVEAQTAGGAPEPWPGLPAGLPPRPEIHPAEWDSRTVRSATEAVVAADDGNSIIAASPAALELLGWDEDLIGQRIAALIPERYREAHIASFTTHLLTGERRILDREVTVPALRRDGTEVPVSLLVRREGTADGRVVFTATMRKS